ncbi:hypothetical protein R3P38DRAFT_2954932 [Favolaschia claudopus]|uniref:Uncharacterized protein n=1 Tax=Favolaschia claudopus TaxID=2862362 RepID=A0AAW0BCN4_9AGAR
MPGIKRSVAFVRPCCAEIARGITPSTKSLYNWYKNTSGRHRRKAEGKPKSARKAAEKATQLARWDHARPAMDEDYSNPDTSSSPTLTSPYARTDNTPAVTPSPTVAARIPMQYSVPSTLANALQPSPSPPPPPIPPPPITIASLRDAFLNNVDAPLLASQIHMFVMSNPSPLALNPVIFALFQAISTEWEKSKTPPNPFLTRYLGAVTYFSGNLMHGGVSGPIAGARALQMQIRKAARWVPTGIPDTRSMSATSSSAATIPQTTSSMTLELHRMTVDRARRKEHIQWARIHAAALEVGVFTFGFELPNAGVDGAYNYAESRVFSDLMAQDAPWEEDEVDWVAGMLVLQALIRTSVRGDTGKSRFYGNLVSLYEQRWKEMKDEGRQAVVTEALLAAKADLARLAA